MEICGMRTARYHSKRVFQLQWYGSVKNSTQSSSDFEIWVLTTQCCIQPSYELILEVPLKSSRRRLPSRRYLDERLDLQHLIFIRLSERQWRTDLASCTVICDVSSSLHTLFSILSFLSEAVLITFVYIFGVYYFSVSLLLEIQWETDLFLRWRSYPLMWGNGPFFSIFKFSWHAISCIFSLSFHVASLACFNMCYCLL